MSKKKETGYSGWLYYRLRKEVKRFCKKRNALFWMGYLKAVMDFKLITVQQWLKLSKLIPSLSPQERKERT